MIFWLVGFFYLSIGGGVGVFYAISDPLDISMLLLSLKRDSPSEYF